MAKWNVKDKNASKCPHAVTRETPSRWHTNSIGKTGGQMLEYRTSKYYDCLPRQIDGATGSTVRTCGPMMVLGLQTNNVRSNYGRMMSVRIMDYTVQRWINDMFA
ncbi:hypothetical protein KI387_023648, partial [Taxus chinensis]